MATASRSISGSSLTSMLVLLQERRSLSLSLCYNPGTTVTAGWVPGGLKASAGNRREGVPLSQEGGRVGGPGMRRREGRRRRDFLLCKRAGWESRRKSEGSSLSVFIVLSFLLIVFCFLSSLFCGLLHLCFNLFLTFPFFLLSN